MKKNLIFSSFFLCFFISHSLEISAQCWLKTSSGFTHTAAIQTDGSLWAWGSNAQGELGDGTVIQKLNPTQIGNAYNWSDVVCGYYNTMAIKSDGTLWAWGYNFFGQLGDGTLIDKHVPTQIGNETNWSQVSVGQYFTLAIKTDGTLWAWGYNLTGQLGDGTTLSKNVPTQIGIDTDWTLISAGNFHSFATKIDNSLWSWGKNDFGQLGNGTIINQIVPNQIGIGNDWSSIAVGNDYSIAIKKDDKTLWACGSNDYGQHGDGTTLSKQVLTQIGNDVDWKAVSAGFAHTLALKTDSTLWAWGWNAYGQLCNSSNIGSTIPISIGSSKWKIISAGMSFTSLIQANSALYLCGNNSNGQLGDGTLANKNIPGLIYCNNIPLGLRLDFFKGIRCSASEICLNWKVSNEINLSHFEIESSNNALQFNKIGTVVANNKSSKPYDYIDFTYDSEKFYRLKIVDINQQFSYSSVLKAESVKLKEAYILNNPAKDFILIQGVGRDTKIQIHTIKGQLVKQFFTDEKNIKLSIDDMLDGIYILTLITDNGVKTEKILIQR